MYLTRSGVIAEYQTLVDKIGNDGIRKIKKIFTIITIGHNNTRKTITAVKIIKAVKANDTISTKLLLPRFGGFMLFNDIENRLQRGTDIKLNPNMKLTPNQSQTLKYLKQNIYTLANVEKGTSSTILQMDPGYGKTYLSFGVINEIKKKTMIIVPNTYLLRQWVDTLDIAFPDSKIGQYYGLKKIDGDIIVAIVNSALKYPDYTEFGLIIYDEVHMYCSKKSSAIFSKAQAACCLGLTATPEDRIDKFDPVAQWSLGNVIYADKLPGWNSGNVNFSTNVTRVIYGGHKDYTRILESATGIVSVPLMINQLQEDPHRNRLIVAYAIKLYKTGKNVFVFSDRREHLHMLANLLIEQKIHFDAPELETIKKLMGGSTNDDIENAKNVGRIIMTTYQYSGTGVSINKMNSLILATPRRSNMKQILGRIYRLTSDQTIVRQIIDIVDNKICLKSQYYSRKKAYINLQATMSDKKIGWQECGDINKLITVPLMD